MKKIFEKAYLERKNSRKISIIIALISVALLVLGSILYLCYLQTDIATDKYIRKFERTIVLDNGITFKMKPMYKHNKLCVHLNITRGFARLYGEDNYDIHPVDSDGFDIASVKFYYKDFSEDHDNNGYDAYKCSNIEKYSISDIKKFMMRYPAWVEDN